MKITIVALLLVTVLLLSSMSSNSYNNIAATIESQVEKANATARLDPKLSKAMLMQAMSTYREHELFMASTLHHEEMHQVDDLFLDAKSYIECNDIPRYIAELYKLKRKMEHLKKMESFTLNDIF